MTLPASVLAAYRQAWGPSGLAFAAPQFALVLAVALAYGGGLILAGGRLGDAGTTILLALILALVGLVAGIGIGWARGDRPTIGRGSSPRWLGAVGCALLAVGIVSMVLYLVRIGQIPLLMSSVEQGRVDAAQRGGAPLRVLSLLSLPGAWLLVASASNHRRLGPFLVAWAFVVVGAVLQALTANRSPAFQLLSVAVLISLLASGHQRLRVRGLAILVLVATGFVIAAGAFGAFRLASAPLYGPPPPGERVMKGPPPDYAALTVIAIRGYAVVPAQNFAYTMDAVPEQIGWRLGSTYLQPLVTILPGHQPTFDQDLKAALDQTYAGGGTVPSLLGESYANFGPAGWLVIPFLVAVGTAWLYRLADRRQTPALWALYAFAIFHSCGSALSGLFVASVFPFEAYLVLGVVAFLEWRPFRPPIPTSWRSRITRRERQSGEVPPAG